MTKQIARLILLAQASSDEGKGKTMLSSLIVEKKTLKLAESGYPEKDAAIMKLLQLLSQYTQKDCHFYVWKDAQKVAHYIVYFDVVFDGSRRQISFHSFDGRLKRFLLGSRNSHVEWSCCESSRKNAYELALKYGLVYEADYVVC